MAGRRRAALVFAVGKAVGRAAAKAAAKAAAGVLSGALPIAHPVGPIRARPIPAGTIVSLPVVLPCRVLRTVTGPLIPASKVGARALRPARISPVLPVVPRARQLASPSVLHAEGGAAALPVQGKPWLPGMQAAP